MGERKDWGGFRADSRGSPAPHPYIWARSIAARPGPKEKGVHVRRGARRACGGTDLISWTLIETPGMNFNSPALLSRASQFNSKCV